MYYQFSPPRVMMVPLLTISVSQDNHLNTMISTLGIPIAEILYFVAHEYTLTCCVQSKQRANTQVKINQLKKLIKKIELQIILM